MKITDFKVSYKNIDTAIRAQKMFELRKQICISSLSGNYRDCRKYQKALAKTAVEDFETFKTLPLINFSLYRMPIKDFLALYFNNLKSKLFLKFFKKTPEEKLFNKLRKDYFSNLTKDELKEKTIDIPFRPFF